MKKKLQVALMFLILCIALTGCFEKETSNDTTTTINTTNPDARNADFDLNGYYAVLAPSPQYKSVGDLVTEPSGINRRGYDLLGWYTEKEGINQWDFSNDILQDSHILLYAKWEKQEYTITYDLNGGSGNVPLSEVKSYFEVDDLSKEIVNKLTLPNDGEPIKSGEYNIFTGWWEKDDLGNYKREWNFSTDIPVKDTILYAGWGKEVVTSRYEYYELESAIKITNFIPEIDPLVNEIVIPSTFNEKTVLSIGSNAFDGINDYIETTLPAALTTIKDEAFINSYCIGDITIPDSVTSIGIKAFYNCDNLYNVSIGTGVLNIGKNAFSGCEWLQGQSSALLIPGNVLAIEDGAFSASSANDNHIGNLVLNNGLVFIGKNAFQFSNCSLLTIPDTVEYILDEAFINNDNLTNIIIGKAITYIGAGAFINCTNGTHVDVLASVPPTLGSGTRVFGNIRENFWIKVPEDSLNAYKNAENWNYYINRIVWFIIT